MTPQKILTILFIFIAGLAITPNASVEAQAACNITSATFRTTKTLDASFFDDNIPPYVYIDLETSNCVGADIEISITENDPTVDTDVNGTNGQADPCGTNYNGCMDNRVINVPQNNITLSLRAGEDECEQIGGPDCDYYVRTWDAVGGEQSWNTGLQLNYDCYGLACDKDWVFEGLLQNFEGTDLYDPDDSYDGGDEPGDGPGSGGDEPGDGPNSSGGDYIVDLGLENPLAGTVDTIPEFIQKIVYIIIKIGVPLVAMAILYSGFLFVTARGREAQLATAKTALWFAIIGGLVLLGAWLIAEAIRDALMTIND